MQAISNAHCHQHMEGIMCGSYIIIHHQGQGQNQINFMCVIVIDQPSWLKIIKLLAEFAEYSTDSRGLGGRWSRLVPHAQMIPRNQSNISLDYAVILPF